MVNVEIRPRTSGEILDDAWRLYLSDVPLFLSLSGLCTAPFAIALLLLLTLPQPETLAARWVLPGLTALLLPLTGLGAGACQEAFRRLAEGKPAGMGPCLVSALRGGLDHVAARAVLLLAALLGAVLLVVPGLALWVGSTGVHPRLAAGEGRFLDSLRASFRQTQRQPAKALMVFLAGPLLLVCTVLNLHLFLWAGLWIAENLAGLDVAFLSLSLSLTNWIYLAALVLLSWLLLAPYAEAANYLLYIDGRARFEGLDLWYRVQRLFPAGHKAQAGLIFLALSFGLLWPAGARAADRLLEIRKAHKEIAAIRKEVETANPYPGGNRWLARLQNVAEQLDPGGTPTHGGYRWFRKALDGFGQRKREDALGILAQLDGRLSLLEDTLSAPSPREGSVQKRVSTEELKNLLPGGSAGEEGNSPPTAEPPPKDKQTRERVPRDDPADDGMPSGPRGGSGVLLPQPVGGLGSVGWTVLVGLLVAIGVVGLVFFLQGRKKSAPAVKAPQVERTEPSLESILTRPDEYSVAGLWRQAEEWARRDNFLEAVRTLYLAVLALLHRGNLIRYERTRTNGEYVRQLHAWEALQQLFRNLTAFFELAWYGGQSCGRDDYTACLRLAEEIRTVVK